MSTFRSASSGNSGTITKPAGVVQNDVQIAILASDGGTPSTISGGATWTQIGTTQQISNGDTQNLAVYRQVAGAAEPASYTISGTTDFSVIIAAYIGVDTTTPIAAFGFTNPNSASPPSSPVSMATTAISTTAVNQTVVWAGTVDWNSTSVAAFTDPSSTNRRAAVTPALFSNAILCDFVQAASGTTGTITGVGTLSGGIGNFAAVLIALKDAASAAVLVGSNPAIGPGVSPNLRTQFTARQLSAVAATNVTVALSGQSIAVSAGLITPNITLALSGQSIAAAAGSLVPSIVITLSGQSVIAAAGSVVPNPAFALSGQTTTISAGALSPSTAIPLAGIDGIFSQGSIYVSIDRVGKGTISGPGISPDYLKVFKARNLSNTVTSNVTLTLSGQDINSASGILTITTAPSLVGSLGTLSVGSLAPLISTLLNASTLAVSSGATLPLITIVPTGSLVTASMGFITPSALITLNGQAISINAGNVLPSFSIPLVGSVGNFSLGTITVSSGGNVTVALSGTALALATGTPSVGIAALLNGQSLVASIGVVEAQHIAGLSGQASTMATGLLGLQHGALLNGQAINLAVGVFGLARSLALSGIDLTATAGTVTASVNNDKTIALSGTSIATVLGSLVVSYQIALASQLVNVQAGTIRTTAPAGPSPTYPYAWPEGLRATSNPWGNLQTNEPLAAGPDGLIVGRFAWVNAELQTVSNRWALGFQLGFVPLIQLSYPGLHLIAGGLLQLRAGYAAVVVSFGDFWARFPYGAQVGDRVYAAAIDGAPISGQAIDAMPTRWKVATNCAPGELAIITIWRD